LNSAIQKAWDFGSRPFRTAAAGRNFSGIFGAFSVLFFLPRTSADVSVVVAVF